MFIFHIVKKDFLLVKKYVPFMFLVSIIIPLFICSRLGEHFGNLTGYIAFSMQVVFTQILLDNSVSLVEVKNRKAQSLLCATPYTRSLLVAEKYVFNLILFAYCTTVYIVLTLVLPSMMGQLSIKIIGFVFLLVTIIFSLKIPLEYKFGYDKIKYIFFGIMISLPYIFPFIVNKLSMNSDILNQSSSLFQGISLFVLALFIGVISFVTAKKIYYGKDL